MSFSDIQGNNKIKEHLINITSINKIPHAQMFIGPEGSAILPIIIAFVKYLNCKDKLSHDSCGKCISCRQIDKLIHPDVHLIFPITKLPTIKSKEPISLSLITEWRKFVLTNPYGTLYDWNEFLGGEAKQFNIPKEESRSIIKTISLKPYGDGYKIILIWLPEYMNSYTSNAILKVLEEPPKKTLFLLASNNIDSIPKTLISRVQCSYLKLFDDKEIASYLCNKNLATKEKAIKISSIVNGNLNDAIKLTKQENIDNNFLLFQDWMRMCYAHNYDSLIFISERFAKNNKELQKYFLKYSIKLFRSILILLFNSSSILKNNREEITFIQKMSKYLTFKKIEAIAKELEDSSYKLERNANAKITFLNMSLIISKIFR